MNSRRQNNPAVRALVWLDKQPLYKWGGRGLTVLSVAVNLGANLNDAEQYVSEAVVNTSIESGASILAGALGVRMGVSLGLLFGPGAVIAAPAIGGVLGFAFAAGGDIGGNALSGALQPWTHEYAGRVEARISRELESR